MTEQTLKAIVAEFVGGFCFFFIAAGAVVTDAYIVARGGQGLGVSGMALASGLGLAANFWDSHLVNWLGPLIGAVFAGFVYGWFFLDSQRDEGTA